MKKQGAKKKKTTVKDLSKGKSVRPTREEAEYIKGGRALELSQPNLTKSV